MGLTLLRDVGSNEQMVRPSSNDGSEEWGNDWDPEVVWVVGEDARSVDEVAEKSWSEVASWVNRVSEVHSVGGSDHHDDKSEEKWMGGSWDSVSLVNDNTDKEDEESSSGKLK